MGLRPKRRDSGERSPQLSITKIDYCGDCWCNVRNTFWDITGKIDLRRWGLGLAARGGPCAKRKAIVAVARKLAVLMHLLWRQDVDFDPFYQTNPRAAG